MILQNETTKKMTKLHNLYVELANSIYDLKTFINTPTEELNKKDEIKGLEITISKLEKDLEPEVVRYIKRFSDFVSPTVSEKKEITSPCQNCGELVNESEALGKVYNHFNFSTKFRQSEWLCPDCY